MNKLIDIKGSLKTIFAGLFFAIVVAAIAIFVYKRWFAEPPVRFGNESIKDISEFHALSYRTSFNYYGYRRNNPKKKLLWIAEIPVNTSLYFDMDKSESEWNAAILEKIIIPTPQLKSLDFELQNIRTIDLNTLRIIIRKDPEGTSIAKLQKACEENEPNIISRIYRQDLALIERAKNNISAYLKTWVKNFQEEEFDIVFIDQENLADGDGILDKELAHPELSPDDPRNNIALESMLDIELQEGIIENWQIIEVE